MEQKKAQKSQPSTRKEKDSKPGKQGKGIFKKELPSGDSDFGTDPEKKKEIGDNPGETEKKIPRMQY